ncbi:MAG: hypothetical protein ACOZNI_28065 [Myxococcota bacterium]
MNPLLRDLPDALRVNLTVPSTTVRLGPIAFDALKTMLGVDLGEVLAPLMVAARHQRPLPGGGVLDVFPLAIPEGEGLTVPIRMFGELGFKNMHGFLLLILPAALAEVVQAQLAQEIVDKLAAGPRFNYGTNGGYVCEFAVRLVPGMRKAIPLANLGEIGVEAA